MVSRILAFISAVLIVKRSIVSYFISSRVTKEVLGTLHDPERRTASIAFFTLPLAMRRSFAAS